MSNILVIGSGHAGCAFSAYLGKKGYPVHLYDSEPFKGNLTYIKKHGGLTLTGSVIQGFGPIKLVTTDIEKALEDVEVILIVVPAFAHRIIAKDFAPYFTSKHTIVLNPGSVFGALDFTNFLRENGNNEDLTITEAASSIFACRRSSEAEVLIKGIKQRMPVACIPHDRIETVISKIKPLLPYYDACPNIIYSSFLDINAMVHPVGAMLNSGWIEYSQGKYDFYWEGLTPGVCRCMEAIDSERVKVSKALGFEQIKLIDLIHDFYGCWEKKTLYEYFYKSPVNGGPGSTAPTNMQHRYITEDVPYGLVPIAEIGKKFGVDTPCIDAIIDLACAVNETNYWSTGRSLENLKLAGLPNEVIIHRLLNGKN